MKKVNELSILIVDDEPMIRTAIKQLLQTLGSPKVAEAANVSAALMQVAEKKPDLVLCDFSMQPLSGMDFLGRLRGHANMSLRPTPVVMLATNADLKTIPKAQRLGIEGYMVKPVSPKDLAARLEFAMKRERVNRTQTGQVA